VANSPSFKQLEAVAEEFARVRARFATLESRVSDAEWSGRPSPEQWSVAECIAHLNLTSAAMLPRLRSAFSEAKALEPVSARRYRGTVLGRVLAAMVGPVPVLLGFRLGRTRTPAAFVPGSDLPRSKVAAEFRQWNTEEAALVREAEGLSVDRVQIESPFVAGAKYDGFSSLWILARHEHRHLEQAERALTQIRSEK